MGLMCQTFLRLNRMDLLVDHGYSVGEWFRFRPMAHGKNLMKLHCYGDLVVDIIVRATSEVILGNKVPAEFVLHSGR